MDESLPPGAHEVPLPDEYLPNLELAALPWPAILSAAELLLDASQRMKTLHATGFDGAGVIHDANNARWRLATLAAPYCEPGKYQGVLSPISGDLPEAWQIVCELAGELPAGVGITNWLLSICSKAEFVVGTIRHAIPRIGDGTAGIGHNADDSADAALEVSADARWAYQRYYHNQSGVEFNLVAVAAAAKNLAATVRKRCPIVGQPFPFKRQELWTMQEVGGAADELALLLDYSKNMPPKMALHINAIRAYGHPQRAAAVPIQRLWDTYHDDIAPAMAKALAGPSGTLAEFEQRTLDALEMAAAELDALTAEQSTIQPPVVNGQTLENRLPAAALPPDAWLSHIDLANQFKLASESLRKRLDRWREKHAAGDDWKEVPERKPREPRYLYRLGAVSPIISEMAAAASGETSG